MFVFNHTTISVNNLSKSLEFYKQFGFNIVKEYHDEIVDIYHLKLNNVILEIFHYVDYFDLPEHAKDLGVDLKTIGNKHFGLGVKDILKAKEYIESKGIYKEEIKIVQGRLGKPYFFIKDPDGILMEIIQE